MSKNLPDFIIIGAGKAGTTSLDKYLQQHPEIYMSPKKEPNFFGYEGLDPESFQLPETKAHFHGSITTLEEYQQLFNGAKNGQLKGEVSNLYLYSDQAHQKIKQYIPQARLIAILRHPAERLYSRYLHLVRDNMEPSESFEDLFDKNGIWWKRPDLIHEGFYYKHLKKFYELFPSGQIKVVFYENLKEDPVKLLQEILAFVGATSSFVPDFETQYNKSGLIKNKFINALIGRKGMLLKGVNKISPKVYTYFKNSSFSQKWINHFRNKNLYNPKLPPELKARITEEIYKEDIQNLEKLLQVDLNSWLQVNQLESV